MAVLKNAIDELSGKYVRGIGAVKLVEDAIFGLDCVNPPFFVHDCQLWYDTEKLGEIAFVEFIPHYSEDKSEYSLADFLSGDTACCWIYSNFLLEYANFPLIFLRFSRMVNR
ncbi:MAG: hypothetical protein NC413_00665 [Muribaculum sp.]|nr:hypothetical protein [Muribaculum sp.]